MYLDDLIVFGKTLVEHEVHILKVLDWLEECGLNICTDKCQPQVKFFGHIVSTSGIAIDHGKVSIVTHWKKPTDPKSLRSFVGFCGYYRQFIENYSAIVCPLTMYTKDTPLLNKKMKSYLKERKELLQGLRAFWKLLDFPNHQHGYTCNVLAFADPQKPYVLHVDASLNEVEQLSLNELLEIKTMKELLTIRGSHKSRTSPCHSHGDLQPKSFHCTLLSMLIQPKS